MVWVTEAAKNGHILLEKLKLDDNTIYAFDKGYNNDKAFKLFSENNKGFVTWKTDIVFYPSNEMVLVGDPYFEQFGFEIAPVINNDRVFFISKTISPTPITDFCFANVDNVGDHTFLVQRNMRLDPAFCCLIFCP